MSWGEPSGSLGSELCGKQLKRRSASGTELSESSKELGGELADGKHERIEIRWHCDKF